MDTVVPLVRAVVRAFYTDEHAIVVEPLLRDPYYLEDDNQAKGTLSRKFGWIASKIIRQRLDALVEHSLVQKKEIIVTINLDTGDATDVTRHKRDFYYIDFVHFLKIITLRFNRITQFVFQTKREAVVPEWTCFPDCDRGRVFSLIDVAQLRVNTKSGQFICPSCGNDLDAREQQPSADDGDGDDDDHANPNNNYEGVNEKLQRQLRGEVDFRDGIRELMTQAHNLGTDLPDNDPAKKFKKLELDSKRQRLAAEAAAAGEALADDDAYRNVAIIATQDKEMPTWFKTTHTGELTEDAIQDAKQRKLRNQSGGGGAGQGGDGAQQDDYVKRYEEEMLAKAALAEEAEQQQKKQRRLLEEEEEEHGAAAARAVAYPVFTFKSGQRVEKRPDMTEDEYDQLAESCPEDEYEAFVTFFQGS